MSLVVMGYMDYVTWPPHVIVGNTQLSLTDFVTLTDLVLGLGLVIVPVVGLGREADRRTVL